MLSQISNTFFLSAENDYPWTRFICFTQLWSWLSQLIVSCMSTVSILRMSVFIVFFYCPQGQPSADEIRYHGQMLIESFGESKLTKFGIIYDFSLWNLSIGSLDYISCSGTLKLSYSQFHIHSLCWGALKRSKRIEIKLLKRYLYSHISLELYAQWPKVDICKCLSQMNRWWKCGIYIKRIMTQP